jgi:hypothetical protein
MTDVSFLLAVDFEMLRLETRWGGVLGVICGVLGLLIGSLLRHSLPATLLGGVTGALAAYVCARVYANTYGFDSIVGVFLPVLLPVGVACGSSAAFGASLNRQVRTRRDRLGAACVLVLAFAVGVWFYFFPSLPQPRRHQPETGLDVDVLMDKAVQGLPQPGDRPDGQAGGKPGDE